MSNSIVTSATVSSLSAAPELLPSKITHYENMSVTAALKSQEFIEKMAKDGTVAPDVLALALAAQEAQIALGRGMTAWRERREAQIIGEKAAARAARMTTKTPVTQAAPSFTVSQEVAQGLDALAALSGR